MNDNASEKIPVCRVCILVEGFLPLQGGFELHAYGLAEALISRGAELSVLTRQIDPRSAVCVLIG